MHTNNKVKVRDNPRDSTLMGTMTHPIITGDIGDIVEEMRNRHPMYTIILVHGCNCFNTMGAGLARRIKELYPSAVTIDNATVSGDKDKLGTYTAVNIDRDLIVANLYTQYNYGRGGIYLDYDALQKCFNNITTGAMPDYMYLIPKNIGCGLAGGNPDIVGDMIEKSFIDYPYYLFDM